MSEIERVTIFLAGVLFLVLAAAGFNSLTAPAISEIERVLGWVMFGPIFWLTTIVGSVLVFISATPTTNTDGE